jgi:NAD(P)-dependent dehydrogenase (short-subunit alcohol dehydrogenase family)
MDVTRHQGKTAIVTGAGSGIGRATVLRLAQEGARVVALDVNQKGLDASQAELETKGLKADFLRADVTSQDDIQRVVEAAGDQIDILANVAGVMDHFIPLGELDDDTWDRVIAVNLTGVMRLTRAVLPLMQAAGGGAIVTVASKSSQSAGAAGVAYTSSKHGVAGLVKHVAYFYGPEGIRSNAVLPGAVDPRQSGIGATADPRSTWAVQRAQLSWATMGAPAQPDQIAAAVSWLASDEASNINGALITSDGGWSTA